MKLSRDFVLSLSSYPNLNRTRIHKAVEELEESAFTDQQLLVYDKFWDMVSTSRTLINGAIRRGLREGMQKGMEKGLEKGMKKGMAKGMQKGMEEGLQQGIQ